MSDDERAIRDLIATWIASSKSGDIDTVLSLMLEDVVFMVPGRAFGKAEFAAASRGMKAVAFEGLSDVLEVEVLGNRAWARTHLTVTATQPNGKTVRRAGHTLSIFRKEPDGRWLLMRDANMLA